MKFTNSDAEDLQGHWTIHHFEMNGQTLQAGGASLEVKGDRFATLSMGAEYTGRIELNPAAEPKTFDLIFETGPEAGNRSLGIYTLEQDTWTICLTLAAQTRPTSFTAPANSGVAFEILRRATATIDSEVATAFPSPAVLDPEIEGLWTMQSCIRAGHPLDARMVTTGTRHAANGEVTVAFGKQIFSRALYTTDRRAKPSTVDYIVLEGAGKGKFQYGIYKLENGTLTHCFAAPGAARPDAFESIPGDGRTLASWVKAKPSDAKRK